MKRLFARFVLGFLALTGAAVMWSAPLAYAQPVDPFEDVCKGAGASSSACQSNGSQNPIVGPNGVLTRATQIMALITGIASVIMIIVGGFRYVLAGGDSNSLRSARNTVIYALVGAVVAVVAQGLVLFVLSRI